MARRRHEEEEAGEGYFASISDLMVGILFVFLLMLAVFAINFADADKDKEIERLKQQVADLTLQVSDLTEQRDVLLARVARLEAAVRTILQELRSVQTGLSSEQGRIEEVRGALLRSLRDSLAARNVLVEVEEAQGVLRLSSDALFVNNAPDFTDTGRHNALALLEEMGRQLPCFSAPRDRQRLCDRHQPIFETILIEGHSDTNPTTREDGNWVLSTDRALAFLKLMNANAPALVELRNVSGQALLGLAGYADTRTRPNIPGPDARNRRIEIRFLLTARPNDRTANELGRLGRALDDLRQLIEARP